MKALLGFCKTTFVGGVLFLLPLALTVFLLRQAVDWLGKLLEPGIRYLALHSVLGVQAQYILAFFLLLLLGFAAGLLARTGLGHRIRSSLENLILRKVPGYTLIRGLVDEDPNSGRDLRPALVRIAEGKWQMAFIVERHPNGWMTVFLPSAPTPSSGTIQVVSPDWVRELKGSSKEMVMCVMKLGEGVNRLVGEEAMRQE